jgi:hypothetical protein
MGKIFCLLVVVLSSLCALATQKPQSINFACVTQFPSTSFIGEQEGQKLKVTLINHNGVAYMPISSGMVTSNDLKNLPAKAAVMTKVGDRAEFYFDLNECNIYQDKTFTCFRGSTIKGTDGKDIQMFSLMSSFTQMKFSDFVFDQTSMMLGLIVDEKSYYIPMEFQREECGFELK